MVLYNNMLQSLFTSQIKTIAWTLLPLWGMFFLLWRSSRIALVALLPSIISTTAVLGFMGVAGIPLDMMTITVVAVALGIAVDNGTHYIHRFREEFELDGDYVASMRRCHATIGHNMVNSALPVIFGFSILALSNFIPSILFGTLVAVAMVFALLSDLNLLPTIIITFKPFGPGKKP
jgi:predicted RND superfamily exporter protein